MKVKILRRIDTKEFVHFIPVGLKYYEGISNIPNLMSMEANMEDIKELYGDLDEEINFNDFELIEYDIFESDVSVGDDIRNKLTSPLSLLTMVKHYFKEKDEVVKAKLKRIISKEIKQSKKNIEYIATLL